MTEQYAHLTASPLTVLIAGIGGGSLGLEMFKSLRLEPCYRLIGADVSEAAFGLELPGFAATYRVPNLAPREYAQRLLEICLREGVEAVAPGAEATHAILDVYRELFEERGILTMLNSREVISACGNKVESLRVLEQRGIAVPAMLEVQNAREMESFGRFPCIVKPSRQSGASNMVFLAQDREEALFFTTYICKRASHALLQQYIDSADEFTVGVTCGRDGSVAGSVALRRSFEQKLSVNMRHREQIISSGWSQGRIEEFPEVCVQAERMAREIGSRWALNVQGRLGRDGVFYPFEINPRHSGTTYLRALAGCNEPHVLLQAHLRGAPLVLARPTPGNYLRALTERYRPLAGAAA